MTHPLNQDRRVSANDTTSHAAARMCPDMLFPNAYVWLVLVSSLDVMITAVILASGGVELNALAAHVIEWGGHPAMVVYKFALMTLAIVMCEEVGRRAYDRGRKLSAALVAISCVPVIFGGAQLLAAAY